MKFSFDLLVRLAVAVILFQTLFFKFTGAEESKYIFSTLGAEPVGRIGSGIVELIAVILILNPGTTAIGAVLSLGVITGAILSHLFILGIDIKGDGGLLFYLALAVFVGSILLIWPRRKTLPFVGQYL
ncbi:MAG: DoxX family protein [Bacteroidetes bacterium]|nr:DoxX family protein [Bacteroidota bacterium]